MERYLAGVNLGKDGVRVSGYVDADDIVEALEQARERWGDVGVMPPSAVERWMRRGAAVNEARNLAASER